MYILDNKKGSSDMTDKTNSNESLVDEHNVINSHTDDNSFKSDIDFDITTLQEQLKQVRLVKPNNQIKELQTLLRDRTTSRSDFKFYADRLIRLVVEEGLNQLPYIEQKVTTPTGHCFQGVRHEKGTLCVSLMRSGEAMEKGIRECCRSIRIGKILVNSDSETNESRVIYAKLPPDVHQRRLLVAYPVVTTGTTVITGLQVLIKDYQCHQSNIILLVLFSTPDGIKRICQEYPKINIVVSEIHQIAPNHFGQKYFGTD